MEEEGYDTQLRLRSGNSEVGKMPCENTDQVQVVKAKPERKVYRSEGRLVNKIPNEILKNAELNSDIKALPKNYNFEIHKTIWRIKQLNVSVVALQFPEGLLLFATTIANIISKYTGAECVIMGDVTYGACCIDDFTAKALGVELLVHYGHSCLIPVDQTEGIKVLYVFVDIKIDANHFIETIKLNFPPGTKLGMVSTIQFLTTLHGSAENLRKADYSVTIPQSKPLSPGEILGCTAPTIADVDVLVYLGDGRFHLEAAMIANPHLRAYKYDPYRKKLTEEFYDTKFMMEARKKAIEKAKDAKMLGLILGTLGRQGSPRVLKKLEEKIQSLKKDYVIVMLSEIFPQKLEQFDQIGAWIQIACPRLSIDWGIVFKRPLLSPYEGAVVLDQTEWTEAYPMDFYSDSSRGPWTPKYKSDICCGKDCKKH